MLYKNHSYGKLLSIGSALLSPSPSNHLDAHLLLCKASGFKKEYIIAHQTDPVDRKVLKRYYLLLGKRKRKIPLAYILGEKEFYNLKFKVNSDVLIPRPETEGLIDLAIKHITNYSKEYKVLDLGTGSGCIAISLLKLVPANVSIDAVDISKKALSIARLNSKAILGENTKKIKFLQLDYLTQRIVATYDLIIANPPYVPIEIKHVLEKEIGFEPQMAIFADGNGLQYYYAIKDMLLRNLSPTGKALIEIGPQKYEDLFRIFSDSFKFEIKPDLTGRNRYLIISPLL